MVWKADAPYCSESGKIKWEIVPYTRGVGLDLGCSIKKTFPHFIGVDNCVDNELFGFQINPDVRVKSADDIGIFADKSMDFVLSSHLLEHFHYEHCPAVLKEWWRVIKRDGYMTLYLPDEDEYPKCEEPSRGIKKEDKSNPDHKWNVNYDRVIELMRSVGSWDLVDYQKRNQDDEYSLYFVFKKVGSGQHFSYRKPPDPRPRAAVVRYGAFGDLLQASSVYAGLKKAGFHVTGFMTPPASDVLDQDPNIDVRFFQDKDQVPNHLLGEFWGYWRKRFDRFINLSESAEGTLLAIPNRTVHDWPPAARHVHMNKNYLETQHAVAGIPHEPNVRFYSTASEREWARKEKAKCGEFTILWSMAGSSCHKTWPYLDRVIASIMLDFPSAHVVFVGGPETMVLQEGWHEEKRVHMQCGQWDIRKSLSFANEADLVIGPETGVLNSVSCLPMPKVVFLSHSTHENLTRDWVNVHPLASENTTCPGRGKNEAPACHQMHYGWTFCQRGKATGVAQCQEDISFEQAYRVIWSVINEAIGTRVLRRA